MSFTKPAGLRLTDIDVISRSEVVLCAGNSTFTLKLSTLFPDQKLAIKNCSIEIEIFAGEE